MAQKFGTALPKRSVSRENRRLIPLQLPRLALVWASGALFAAAFVILIPIAIWIYMLVFAFSSLWFAHFALAALAERRERSMDDVIDVPATTVAHSPHATDRLASPHEPFEDHHTH